MIRFHPLPSFGVEAEGVDLSTPLADDDFRALEEAFYANHVLALRGQKVTAAEFAAFARRIGPPQPHVIDQFHHPDDANILILSNVRKDGEPTGLQDAGSYFHTDYSYLAVPARATTLYSRVVPKVGGDTLFADQQAAYDDLPQAMKTRIEPLLAIHHYGNRHDVDESSRTAASVLSAEQKARMPVITHRIARPHPVTGRTCLYAVSGSSFGIVSLAFGLVTPPYGLCLMISCAIAKVRLMYVMKDVMIMLLPMLGVLALTIVLPELILFLPRMVSPEFLK